ncbi:hypothetical protein [Brachybacterium sp. sponge]|uniref:hypothetical protein n=1 Tax=Brachybacterium sp. sponge TaxID=1775432 RepID=UPI000B2BA574|nr:hypothetical protein [Brachybacterium sp. sponge]
MRSRQRRSSSSGGRARAHRAALPGAALVLALGGCATEGPGEEPEAPSAASEEADADPALTAACTGFWGDPEYARPLSREVLDRAGSAPEVGPSDPGFYAMTGDDVEDLFADAPEGARAAATELADWFRTQPERGAEADRDTFADAFEGVAAACQDVSAAALWAAGGGEAGTKPAALVCADVFDTPGTLTHFANSNVLTSNMFKLVGLSPREVPSDRTDDLRATAELLDAQITVVDDDAVRTALEQVRAPFADALDGDTWSDGLQDPLDQLSTACAAQGYHAPAPAEEGGDAVVGAPAPADPSAPAAADGPADGSPAHFAALPAFSNGATS